MLKIGKQRRWTYSLKYFIQILIKYSYKPIEQCRQVVFFHFFYLFFSYFGHFMRPSNMAATKTFTLHSRFILHYIQSLFQFCCLNVGLNPGRVHVRQVHNTSNKAIQNPVSSCRRNMGESFLNS